MPTMRTITACGLLAAAAPIHAALLTHESPVVEVDYWRVSLAVAVCLMLAAASALLLKWRMNGGGLRMSPGQRRMRLAETLPLAGRRAVHLIECDGNSFMLLVEAKGPPQWVAVPPPPATEPNAS